MNIKKRELIISIIMIIAFIILSFNFSVSATNLGAEPNKVTLTIPTTNLNNTNMIEVVDNTNSIPTNNTTIVNTNTNSNTNTPGQLANTGLEDLPWLVIGLCAVSAVFAYSKIREYKSI